MSGRARCDEILRLIDMALGEAPGDPIVAATARRGSIVRDDDGA